MNDKQNNKKRYVVPWYAQPAISVIALVLAYMLKSSIFLAIGIVLIIIYYILQKKVIDFYKKVDNIDNYELTVKQNAELFKTEKEKEAAKSQNIADKNAQVVQDLKKQAQALQKEIKIANSELVVAESNVFVDYNITSAEYKDKLSLSELKEKDLIKENNAVIATAISTKSVINANIKQIIRCFNSESSSIIKSVTVKNVDTLRNRLVKSFEMLNKIYRVDGVELTKEFLELKLEQLNLMYSYQITLANEKEEQKAIREQMLEEEKARREIEKEKAKIEKEEQQFKKEIDKLMAYLHKAQDIEKQLYIDKIQELEEKLKLLEKDKENVLEREQNTRSGFVYIISNIGSFGENIYKIGMTRRLEPMDRIKELSSASVPFEFDVHAMIFSKDAPKLESTLHNYFNDKRVNKVNDRKEFFKVTLDEIEKVVRENYNATVTFTRVALAEQYRQSLKIENSLIKEE